jgi:outer membrane murein-binding lipoprotein Lpp
MAFRRGAANVTAVLFLFAVLAVPQACALEVIDNQKNIELTIERGDSYEFPLLLQNVQEKRTLSSYGDVSGWVRIFGVEEFEVNPAMGYVMVSIEVPSDIELGEYEGVIRSDGTAVSKIRVKVTLELSDVKAYEKLSDVDKEVGTLQEKVSTLTSDISSLRTQVATLESEVSQKMEEIYEYQKDLNELEANNEKLEKELTDLRGKYEEAEVSNEELNEITGMLIGTQLPGMFLGGLILGAIAVTAIVKRELVKKKLRDKVKRSGSMPKDEGGFRYSYKGR